MKEMLLMLGGALNKLANGAGSASAVDNPTSVSVVERILTFIFKLLSNIVGAIVNLFFILMITVCKLILNIVDFFCGAVRELVGQSVVDDFTNKSLSNSDMVFKFLNDNGIKRVIYAFIGIGIILIIIFAIFAVIKKEYENFLNGDSKSNNKKVIVRMLTAFFLVIIVPIIAIGGIIFSDILLASVDKAINKGQGNATFATQLYAAATYESNEYRLYAEKNKRVPIIFDFYATETKDIVLPSTENANNEKMNQDMVEFLGKSVFVKGVEVWYQFFLEDFYTFSEVEMSTAENGENLWNMTYDKQLTNVSRIDYYVMADMVDFLLRSRVALCVVNAYDLLNKEGGFVVSSENFESGNMVDNKWPVKEENGTYTFRVFYNSTFSTTDAALKTDGNGNYYKDFTFNQSRDEAQGACYLLCTSYIDENNNEPVYRMLFNNDKKVNRFSEYFFSDYLRASQPIVARGCFSSDGYPTAIREVGANIEFYREDPTAPSLLDILPKITYEKGVEGDSAFTDYINAVFKTVTGLDTSDIVPKIYFRNNVFDLFTKREQSVATLYSKELYLDYNFSKGISIHNVESVGNVNIIILAFGSVMLMSMLAKIIFGLISRIFDIVLLFITYPVIAATISIDDGKRFGEWVSVFVGKVFAAYGIVIGFNLIIILSRVVAGMDNLFSLEFVSNNVKASFFSLYSLYFILNNAAWVMFFLVLFTLFKTAGSVINSIVSPKSEDVIQTGEAVLKDVSTTLKKGSDLVSGKVVLDTVVRLAGDVWGFVPGSAVVNKYYYRRKAAKAIDKANEEIEKQINTLLTGSEEEINKMNKKNS